MTNKEAKQIIEDCSFSTMVDLNLPSGLKWASCNIGANNPTETGLLFQWGRTDGYIYGDVNHKFINGFEGVPVPPSGKTYKNKDVLDLCDDAAYQISKGQFRMPTKEEIDELLEHTHHQWLKVKYANIDVRGTLFTSKKDITKKIFIPAGGLFDGAWNPDIMNVENCYYLTDEINDTGYRSGFIWSSTCFITEDVEPGTMAAYPSAYALHIQPAPGGPHDPWNIPTQIFMGASIRGVCE